MSTSPAPAAVPSGRRNRATRAEERDRIERTRQLLAAGSYKGEVKKALIAAYGISARTCEAYISRARAEILAGTGRSEDEHRADALALYESIKADPNSTNIEKLKAQERIDKLLALEGPVKVQHSGSVGVAVSQVRAELLGDEEYLDYLRGRQLAGDQAAAAGNQEPNGSQ
jgi:hypothetical protein